MTNGVTPARYRALAAQTMKGAACEGRGTSFGDLIGHLPEVREPDYVI